MTDKTEHTCESEAMQQFLQIMKKAEPIYALHEKKYDINKTGVSYRAINSWESAGLLDDHRSEQGHGWRKFSIIDLAFISLISRLRKLGLPIKKLKNTKKVLFDFSASPEVDIALRKFRMTLFEFAYARVAALKNENTYLLVKPDGQAEVMTEKDLQTSQIAGDLPDTHVSINLSDLFKEHGNEESSTLGEKMRGALSKAKPEKITITRNGEEFTFIEKEYSGSPKDFDSIHKLVEAIPYGEVILQRAGGKTYRVRAIKREKVENAD